MNLKDLQAKAAEELRLATMKVESTFGLLQDAADDAKADLQQKYQEAVIELSEKLITVKEIGAKVDTFVGKYGKFIVLGGLGVLAVLAVGYLSGFFAA